MPAWRVNSTVASGSGLLRTGNSSATTTAVGSPEAAGLFGAAHTTDWMPFAGEFRFVEPYRRLTEHWGLKAMASDPPEAVVRAANSRVPSALRRTASSEAPGTVVISMSSVAPVPNLSCGFAAR